MKEEEKERKRKRDAGRERRNEGWKEYVSNTQHLLYHHLPVALHLQATTSAPRPRRPTCLRPLVRRGGGAPPACPTPTANQYKHMVQRRIIETYGLAPRPQPTNTNIWPSPTPTANQYKHMAEPHTIDYVTPGRFFCLLFKLQSNHYSRDMGEVQLIRRINLRLIRRIQ